MQQNIIERKKEWRRSMMRLRHEIDPMLKARHDAWFNDALSGLIAQSSFTRIHCYIPIGSEIDVRPFIGKMLNDGKLVVSPKTLPARKLENRILHSLDELEYGVMKTLHPAKADIYEGPFDLIIVPGLAFDKRNFRLGYGGGYYDTFLAMHPEAMKVGIFYSFQELDEVPVEAHDMKLDRMLVR